MESKKQFQPAKSVVYLVGQDTKNFGCLHYAVFDGIDEAKKWVEEELVFLEISGLEWHRNKEDNQIVLEANYGDSRFFMEILEKG